MNDKVHNRPHVRAAWNLFKRTGNPAAYCFYRELYQHEYERMLRKGEL